MDEEKVEAILELKPQENIKELKSFLWTLQFKANSCGVFRIWPIVCENYWKKEPRKRTTERFWKNKQMLAEVPCLADYAKNNKKC